MVVRVLLQANVDRDETGGVQTLVRGVDRRLREAGHTVLCSWIFGCAGAAEADGERIDGFHIRPVESEGGRRIHLPSLLKAVALLARFRPDVVNIHYASANAYYFVLLRPLFRYRILVSCHGSDVLDPFDHDAAHMPALLSSADAITGVSPHLVDAIEQSGGEKARLVYLPNGVDTGFWTPQEDHDAATTGRFDVVTAGRLAPVKGFDVLLEAFARLRERMPEARLTIAGEGAERAQLEHQVRHLGLTEHVSMPGTRSREELRALLRGSDLFVLSSRSEGMPLSLLEAMACGLPCVATDVGGVAATCGDAARVVPSEDADALATALFELGANRACASALGLRARERALEFSDTTTFDRYEAIMRSLA